ncbi:hypothetical protein K1719_006115 [Acacia pycnantha]|nr:hypothetical protein K1719_006115 [Acacia pycnantha]
MGGCFSCRSSPTFNTVRVVHLNGFVEYFEGPISVSQVTGGSDMASLAKRLTKKAEIKPCSDKSSSIGWSSPSGSPGRVGVADQIGVSYGGGRSPCRVKPWKPILDTIREKSFNRRESDLQENN